MLFKNKSLLMIIGILLSFLGLTVFFNTLSWTTGPTSDGAVILIMSKEFLGGNWLLHNWTLSQDAMTTVDMPLYVIGVLIRGFSFNLLHNVPAVVYALLVIVSSYLASQGFNSRGKWMARIGVATGLTLVGPWNTDLFLIAVFHITTILMVIISLFLFQSATKLKQIFAYVTMTAAIIGDPLSLFIGPFPILLAIAYSKIRKYKIENNEQYKLALKVIVVLVAGGSIHSLIPMFGGYGYDVWPYSIPNWSQIMIDIQMMMHGIPTIYGINLVGHQMDLTTVGYFARAMILVCLGYVVWKWLFHRISFSLIDDVLVFGMILILASSFIFTVGLFGGTRYYTPFFVFSIILIGRYMAKVNWTGRSVLITSALLMLLIITWIPSIPLPSAGGNETNNDAILTNWLLNHHLYSGYGTYWQSHIITVLSGGNVSVIPVASDGPNGPISDWKHLANSEWYKNEQQFPRTFLIHDNTGYAWISNASAIGTWGKPSSSAKIGNFTILIWDHPIMTHNK